MKYLYICIIIHFAEYLFLKKWKHNRYDNRHDTRKEIAL